MRKLALCIAAVCMISSIVRADGPGDDMAINRRSQEFADAWNKHDPKAMAEFFTEDGDLVNPFGRAPHGRAEIVKLFTEEQAGPMAGTTYTQKVAGIRYIKPDVAVVDVDATITGMKNADGAAQPEFKHRVTWVATKQGDTWLGVVARVLVAVPAPDAAKNQ